MMSRLRVAQKVIHFHYQIQNNKTKEKEKEQTIIGLIVFL